MTILLFSESNFLAHSPQLYRVTKIKRTMFPIQCHFIKKINTSKNKIKFHTIHEGEKMAEIAVRKFRLADLDGIKQIARGLHPEWFTEEALGYSWRLSTLRKNLT